MVRVWRAAKKKGGYELKKGVAKKKGCTQLAHPPLYTLLHVGTPWFKFRYQA